MTIDTNIHVILTCDDCGFCTDYEDYDELVVGPAEEAAVQKLGWSYDGETLMCPDCMPIAEKMELK